MSRSLIFLAGRRPLTCPVYLLRPSAQFSKNPLEEFRLQPRPRLTRALFLTLVAMTVGLPLRAQKSGFEEFATFPNQQGTGVTVSPEGRVFVNFPFWSDDHTLSVAESIDGQPKPFPDEAWNAKSGPPENRRICVQSVVVDDQGALWILDPASPKTEGVVKGGPKLVKVDLSTNKARADDSVRRHHRAPTFLFKRCPRGYLRADMLSSRRVAPSNCGRRFENRSSPSTAG